MIKAIGTERTLQVEFSDKERLKGVCRLPENRVSGRTLRARPVLLPAAVSSGAHGNSVLSSVEPPLQLLLGLSVP